MAKTATSVDKGWFVLCVEEAEKDGPLGNLSLLYVEAARLYNEGKDAAFKEISGSVAKGRITEWNLTVKTQPGRRGREKGVPMSEEHKRKLHEGRAAAGPRKNKAKSHPQRQAYIDEATKRLAANNALQFLPLVERAANGSSKARCRLRCLDCMAYVKTEIKKCGDVGCENFLVRPYQKSVPVEGQVDPELAADDDDEEQQDAA
jgi:hypothetical protein